jgi:hypothetical protein
VDGYYAKIFHETRIKGSFSRKYFKTHIRQCRILKFLLGEDYSGLGKGRGDEGIRKGRERGQGNCALEIKILDPAATEATPSRLS